MNSAFLSLVGFIAVMSITPGPNNVMVAASAAHHGLRSTVPHILGITTGFALMIGLVGLGLAGAVTQAPAISNVLRYVAVAWLMVFAWKIASADAPGEGGARPPMGFVGGALFQWVNPKAWLMAVSVTSAFIFPDRAMLPQLGTIVLLSAVVGLPSILSWALLGSGAGRLLGSRARLRLFNVTMAVLLVASILPVAFGE